MTTPALPLDAPSGAKGTTVAAAGENDRPNIPHPAYSRMRPRWEKCRALIGGTEAVRAGGEAYLPRLEGESAQAYLFRQRLCAVFNGFERTVNACAGLLLEKNPELGEDMPARLKAMWEDVDLGGTHGDVYADQLVTDALTDGHAGTLVDYPRVENPDTVSLDEERRLQLRPYWVKYTAADILKAVFGKIGSVKALVLLVLKETGEELTGSFGVQEVVRYRVFRRTAAGITWELWRADASGTGVTRELGPFPVRRATRIPFAFLVAGKRLGAFETRPPLENLADLNFEHHQVKTNLRNLESLACVPTQVRIGAEKDRETGEYPPITLGPRSTIEAPHMEGVDKPVYWHTPDVTVLEPGAKSLQDIKADMGAAGLAFLAPDKRVAETAEAKRLDATAQNASLSKVSRALQDHLEECFRLSGEYIGETAGSVTLNRDFELTILDPAMVVAYTKAAEAGKLSIETFLLLLERGRVLPEGFSREEELRRILTEGVLPPAREEPDDA